MSKDPEQIRAEIAATRGELSTNVNALADSVKPGNVARRQADKARGAAVSVKERIMGATPDLGNAKSSASSTIGDARAAVSDVASDAGGAVAGSPELVRAKTQGNPLAAGLVAFGAGWLIASLIPATQNEQQVAAAVKEKAEPLKQEVSDVARSAADKLRAPAQEAVASVKQTATDAIEHTKSEGVDATHKVKSDTQDAAGTVQDSRS